ncbi:MAG: TonB-dependent receptor [Prevotella sp.]|nr:TonB-dependent receptor [Prevotella sp.]
MKQRLTMLLAAMLLTVGTALAQTKVNGTVTSQEDGEPVIGASVLVVGTQVGTVTDANGKFTLTCPEGKNTLRITYVGMEPLEVSARPNMRIVLTGDQKALDEVVVVAYGTQKKASFTGSAAMVGFAELDQHVTTNVANALAGSVPGLQIRGGNNAPGDSENGKINIRGIASMYANTDPLIIVDGAPYETSLSNISQEDIESISVLKDAASAALYGARGAAGVILITTKKGNKQAPKVNVNIRWGANSRAVQEYDKITNPAQYYELAYAGLNNYYLDLGNSATDANHLANSHLIEALGYQIYTIPDGQYLIGLDGKLNPNAKLGYAQTYNGETYWYQPDDWTDAAYKTGFRQEYEANMSGGTDKSDYFISAGYLSEDGIIDNSSYKRFTARMKANYDITKWLRVGANVGYVHSNTVSNPNNDEYQLGSTNLSYYTSRIAPIYPIYVRVLDENGNPIIRTDANGNPQYDYGRPGTDYPNPRAFLQTGNPLGSNRYNDLNIGRNQLNGTGTVDVKFTDWLRFTSTNTITWNHVNYSKYDSQLYGPKVSVNGEIDKQQSDFYYQNYVQTLNFAKTFGLHTLTATLGHEWYDRKTTYLTATAQGLFTPDVKEINAAANNQYKSGSYTSEYNVEGYFGRLLYNYDEKYFADASFRRDASSRFAKNNRWGSFWSVGAGWLINKEKFFKADWVNQLKLKVSLGQTGNDGLPFDWSFTDVYTLSSSSTTQMTPSFYRIGNENITWETTTALNIGVDFGLFNNRLTGTLEYYNKKTTDLLFWVSVPESFGARGYYGNIGDKRSTGIELTLNADIIRSKKFNWSVNFNIAHNKEKILKLPENKIKVNGGFAETWIPVSSGATSGSVQMWYAEGGSLYCPFVYAYAGVNENGEALYYYDRSLTSALDPETGKPYMDADGNPLNSSATMSLDDDGNEVWTLTNNTAKAGSEKYGTTTKIGEATRYAGKSMLPKAYGGFGTTFSAYGFDVSLNFDYQLGGKIYDRQYASLMSNWVDNGDAGSAFHVDLLNSWTPTNTSSNIPRFQYADNYTVATCDRFLVSASYLNFQSFSVGYTLPKTLTSKISLDKIRVYVTGENLCFWSKRKGLDPRYDYGSTEALTPYSLMRTIMGGIQVSF